MSRSRSTKTSTTAAARLTNEQGTGRPRTPSATRAFFFGDRACRRTSKCPESSRHGESYDRAHLAGYGSRSRQRYLSRISEGDWAQRVRLDPRQSRVYTLRRVADGKAEFLLLTLWESWDAIKAFAGPDYEKAVYYPEDEKFLLALDPLVTHYELLSSQ
jgi:hypothetical protein